GADHPNGHWLEVVELRLQRAVPGVVALECPVEVEDVDELVAGVLWLAEEKSQIDETEHDVTDIGRRRNSPVLENDLGHHAVPLEGERTAGVGELDPGDVTPHREMGLTHLEGCQHEQIRLLVKARLADANPVHDTFAKCQLSHVPTFVPPLRGRICRAESDSSSQLLPL